MNHRTLCSLCFAVAVLALLLVVLPAAAWDDCPRGLTNDPVPGYCVLYEDTDGDGICDHSQAAPAEGVTEATPPSAEEPAGTPGFGATVAAIACGAAAVAAFRLRR